MWQNLIMANYPVDQEILKPYVPPGTELDLWQGKAYVSMVGFMFLNTRVLGIPIPFHRNFEEVNLRFYVRYQDEGEWKRGVVFIKEIVPRFAIVWVANTIYKEHYQCLAMRHSVEDHGANQTVTYAWRFRGEWNHMKATTALTAEPIEGGSEAEFITEHYWGYSASGKKQTIEYQVEHPRWNAFPVQNFEMHCNVAELYGAAFAPFLAQAPSSVFMADGSEIIVREGKKII